MSDAVGSSVAHSSAMKVTMALALLWQYEPFTEDDDGDEHEPISRIPAPFLVLTTSASRLSFTGGDRPWRYVRPGERKEKAHLTGYNRGKAPRFVWPAKLVQWYAEYQAQRR